MAKGQTRITLAALVARREPDWDDAEVGRAIVEGRVLVSGRVLTNPSARVLPADPIRVLPPGSLNGARKLEWALSRFGVAAAGAVVLDVGASTGGFTSAWLAAGADRVYAVDVGHGQLLGSLRQDPRVVNLEKTNVSQLSSSLVPGPISFVSVDVSYLALREAVAQLSVPSFAGSAFTGGAPGDTASAGGAQLIGLVKPMFELRLPTIPTDRSVLASARDKAVGGVAAAGWTVLDVDECPVRGGKGAIEFMLHARWTIAVPE